MVSSTLLSNIRPAASRFIKKDLGILVISITLQMICGYLFGHIYDTRISMASGFLVATGQNPYIAQDLSTVFHNATFQNITTIGYPPPWPLFLGLLYLLSFAITPNFLIYNLVIKIPIIIANIGLAYLVADVILKNNGDLVSARNAWIFMLFNPFLIYAGAAWGQIDSIVAVLALSAIVLLFSGNYTFSAFLLALAISFKPIALPLAIIPFLFLYRKSIRQTFTYYGRLIFGGLLFCVLPFVIFKWDPGIIFHNWNAIFTVGGAMSYLVILEPIQNSYQLHGSWWLIGLIWIPVLLLAAFLFRRGIIGFKDLIIKSTALILVFFLSRSWLSEPNIVLVLPFLLILYSLTELDRFKLTAVWVLPLLFSFFNTGTAQMLFPSMPLLMTKWLAFSDYYRTYFLVMKIAIVLVWQILGWSIVVNCFRIKPENSNRQSKNILPVVGNGFSDDY